MQDFWKNFNCIDNLRSCALGVINKPPGTVRVFGKFHRISENDLMRRRGNDTFYIYVQL